jgi:GNAT superfamily N-acetyltransferase
MEVVQLTSLSEDDIREINRLSVQLGYANDVDLQRKRLQQVIELKDHAIFVARKADEIVAWLHCLVCLRVESPLFVEVTGLVVDEKVRGQHIGQNLIEAAKSWSRRQNIQLLRIRCNVVRTESHKFYQTLGFVSHKEQKVFELAL